MKYILSVLSTSKATHDVLRIKTEKPSDLEFVPGQAADFSINKENWKEVIRPFSFTSIPSDPYLEFTVKTYPDRNGVTNELLHLKPKDEILIHGVFGEISYKGEGLFIAGGAGITPFISIFRDLVSKNQVGNNKLIFANKTKANIINETEFKEMLGANFINILSQEKTDGYANGFITAEFIQIHIHSKDQYFYVCGPDPMMEAVDKQLQTLGISPERIIKEGF